MNKERVNVGISESENLSDKTKFLEFSDALDEWEQSVLFGENGYYSLNAPDAAAKYKEYSAELDKYASEKLIEFRPSDGVSREIIKEIMKRKTNVLKYEMRNYYQKIYRNYTDSVFQKTLELSINRAVLNRNNPESVVNAFQNGLSAIKFFEKDDILTEKQFKSRFYSALIEAFIEDADIKAVYLFNEHKDDIERSEKDKFERRLKNFKTDIIAYNFAKELFSYDISEDKQEKEIKKIKDEEIKKSVKSYIDEFKSDKKTGEENEIKAKSFANMQKIAEILKNGSDNARLYIDYSLPDKCIRQKLDYIKQIKKYGFIKTNPEKFVEEISLLFKDRDLYLKKDLSELMIYFSENDFLLFGKLVSSDEEEYKLNKSDFNYIQNIFADIKNDNISEQYEFLSLYYSILNGLKTSNNGGCDLKKRNETVREIQKRYTDNNLERGNINDGIINNTGE